MIRLKLVNPVGDIIKDISEYTLDDFKLDGYESHPPIKMPLSN
jgi:thymidylate synthase